MTIINIQDYCNNKVLSGYEEGMMLRLTTNLNKQDNSNNQVQVILHDIYSLNISFFLGLFGPSVEKLGELGFRNKYIFICDEAIRENIDDGIIHALKQPHAMEE